ncbi:hypothetical protein H072_4485 [Dactylellina haptotyla CBS 200.50]|uniref:BTB domain-containing protein n=1 Tax=Dactylellina haptotyla (strain CBS 200.50) TaxID=1284197 RepID=S8BQ85_DACHA|nr:hypothetical protein H072_4485 [Dactylellina haptotyla CBS 200.50]
METESAGDPNAAACLYLDDAFSVCWRRRLRIAYTAPSVAECVCTVGGVPDPQIDPAVPACTSYLSSIGQKRRISAFYSSFNGYCSSYGRAQALTSTDSAGTTTETKSLGGARLGRENCEEILGIYNVCQRSPQDLITEPEVASCICHDRNGTFNTAFDDILSPCYSWATSSETEFATEVSRLFGFCTRFGTFSFDAQTPITTSVPGVRTTKAIPTLTFSQVAQDPAAEACEKFAKIANACRTGPLDPLTRVGVANCICVDPGDPTGGFGTAFDNLLMSCIPYAKTKSPAAGSQIESLTGYCIRYADGGKTYTVNGMPEVEINIMKPDVLACILDFIYTGDFDETGKKQYIRSTHQPRDGEDYTLFPSEPSGEHIRRLVSIYNMARKCNLEKMAALAKERLTESCEATFGPGLHHLTNFLLQDWDYPTDSCSDVANCGKRMEELTRYRYQILDIQAEKLQADLSRDVIQDRFDGLVRSLNKTKRCANSGCQASFYVFADEEEVGFTSGPIIRCRVCNSRQPF